jgi:hypothetical protein
MLVLSRAHHTRRVGELAMVSISIADDDSRTLKEFLEAKLVDLRREISHTDSPRFRATLYELEGVLQRTLAQLP